jgi:hypothetical protein
MIEVRFGPAAYQTQAAHVDGAALALGAGARAVGSAARTGYVNSAMNRAAAKLRKAVTDSAV